VAAAGYVGTELGDGFPRDPARLRSALRQRGLEMPSAWCGLGLLAESAERDLSRTRELSGLLCQVGSSFINLAHQPTAERKAFAGRADSPDAPRLASSEWDAVAERVCQAAQIARELGLEATFHAHVGSWVETRRELEELLRRAPAALLKLVWDVGHAIYGGMDPVEVVQSYPERIAYIHLKDVDGAVLDRVRSEKLGFEDGIRRRVFTELGHGLLDVPGLLAALGGIGYTGWLMVEQDSSWLPAAVSARTSRRALSELGL
jgi:inosose dehydratase